MVKQKKTRGENVDILTEVTVSTGTTANITIRRIFARNTKKMAFVQRRDVGTLLGISQHTICIYTDCRGQLV